MWLAAVWESWGEACTALGSVGLCFNQTEINKPSPSHSLAQSLQHSSVRRFRFVCLPQQATSFVCRHELEHFVQKEKCFVHSSFVSTLFSLFWKAKTSYLTAESQAGSLPWRESRSVWLEPALPSTRAQLGPIQDAACGGCS